VGNWINYIEIFNIGYSPDCTSLGFSEALRWGNETAEQIVFEGGKQSLIDSLITYSFDRASAGYKACTLRLGSFTKTYLTDEEIA
jgi:hypothetical protein